MVIIFFRSLGVNLSRPLSEHEIVKLGLLDERRIGDLKNDSEIGPDRSYVQSLARTYLFDF